MSCILSKPAIVLLGAALFIAPNTFGRAKKPAQAAKADPAPASPIPLQAPTPEQMPAQPPHVTFQNGLLAINADNSTLTDVLRNVRTALGIAVDTPPGAGSERVAVHLGPGQPRDVLTQLFAGSHYDYILVGNPNNPELLTQVILTPRQSLASAGNPPPRTTPQPPAYNADADADNDADVDDSQQPEPSASPDIPPENGGNYQPNPNSPANPPQNNATNSSPGGETGGQRVKTPEQLLQELQRLQQQQQQQQQQPQTRQPD